MEIKRAMPLLRWLCQYEAAEHRADGRGVDLVGIVRSGFFFAIYVELCTGAVMALGDFFDMLPVLPMNCF